MAKNNNHVSKSLMNHMTFKVPVVSHKFTMAQTEKYIRKNIHHFDNIDYIYIVDDEYKLVHVISIKDIYRLSPKDKAYMVGKGKKLVKVLGTSHREQVAYVALKNNIMAVPVVDSEGKFLGVVNKQNILSILYKELREDILQMTGIHKSHVEYDSIHEVSLYKSVKHRILWLIIGLFGGMFAAKVIGFFEGTLEKQIILAVFIPLVVYIADAVGTQLEAFVLRDFSSFRKLNFWKYFMKQLSIVTVISLILGVIVMLLSFVIYQKIGIAFILGIAVFAASLSSIFTGLIMPFILRMLNQDPASGSGPIGTIIQDILSVSIYFIVAYLLL